MEPLKDIDFNAIKMSTSQETSQKCSGGNIETPEQSAKTRYRGFCFTSFADEEPDFRECMKYLCYSPETCPTTGRHHWQGYFYLFDQKTLSAAAKIYKCAVKGAIGTADENRTYCGAKDYIKNGKVKLANPMFKEFGTMPCQGKRCDLDAIKDEIIAGKSVDELCVERPIIFHQYGRTLERIEEIQLRKKFRNWMTTCDWFYGATGVGKSHTAFKDYNPSTHYVYNPNDNGFWCGYVGQETVIINEFRGQIQYSELLDLIDKWPKNVKIKGKAPFPFLAKHIIITSCMPPCEVYHGLAERDSLDQLKRRITLIELK